SWEDESWEEESWHDEVIKTPVGELSAEAEIAPQPQQPDRESEVQSGTVSSANNDRAAGTFVSQGASLFNESVLIGEYGIFTIDASGNWLYQLDHVVALQLESHDRVNDDFTLRSEGDSHHTVNITVEGAEMEESVAVVAVDKVEVESTLEAPSSLLDGISGVVGGVIQTLNPIKLVDSLLGRDRRESQSIAEEELPMRGNFTALSTVDGDPDPAPEPGEISGVEQESSADEVAVDPERGQPVTEPSPRTEQVSHFGEVLVGKVFEDGIGKVHGTLVAHGAVPIKEAVLEGEYGTFLVDQQGNWDFLLDHSRVQYLDVGDQLDEVFPVVSGYSEPHNVTITIYGSEDIPLLSGNQGTVQEDRQGTAEGVVLVTDVDEGDNPAIVPMSTAGVYGSLTLDEIGGWRYQLDHSAVQNLDEGERVTDSIPLALNDGSHHAIMVTIEGTEDEVMVGGTFVGEVTEDGRGSVGGLLRIMDVDYGDTPVFEAGSFSSSYGTLDLDEEGYWRYELNHASVQALKQGEQERDTILMTATDDTQKEIVITIYGTDDLEGKEGEAAAPQFTLEDIVSSVVRGHPEVVQAREVLNATEQMVAYAAGGFLPTLELNANSGQELGEPKEKMELKLTQSLFSGFSTRNEVDKAKADYESSRSQLDTVENGVAFRTVNAYMNLLRTRALLTLEQDHLDAHKRVYQQVELRYIQGVGNPSDLSQVEAMLSNAEATIINAETEYADAVSRYEALADEVPDNIVPPTLDLEMPDSLDQALEFAQIQNPDLRNRRMGIDQAQATLELSKSSFLPSVSFEVVGNWDRKGGTPGKEKDLSAMLRMNYLLFNGNRDRSTRQESAYRVNAAVEALGAAARAVKEQISIAWHAYEKQRKLVPFLTDKAVANRKTLSTYKKQYTVQKSTLIDILGAETAKLGSESMLLSAENDLFMAQFSILQSIGVLDRYFGF
ncbi:MAG: TolC family outer membrane protein, partial [Gammaproteobacteria bacterium]|nr:TolC family outer membrane protein [Gammaproteobacteria bacterium]